MGQGLFCTCLLILTACSWNRNLSNAKRRSNYYNLSLLPIDAVPTDVFNYDNEEQKVWSLVRNNFIKQSQATANVILKISDILKTFEKSHCLVIVDNFQNVDIISTAYTTTVIRRSGFAALYYDKMASKSKFDGHKLLWVPYGYLPAVNATKVKNNHNLMCPLSRYFGGAVFATYTEITDLCVALNVLEYSAHTRPWNCQVQLSIQIPPFMLRIKRYPSPVAFDVAADVSEQFQRTERSVVPNLHIFVHDERLPISRQCLRSFIVSQSPSYKPTWMREGESDPKFQFVVTLLVILGPDTVSINIVSTFFKNPDAHRMKLRFTPMPISDIDHMLLRKRPQPVEEMRWSLYSSNTAANLEESVFKFWKKVVNCEHLFPKGISNLELADPTDVFALGIASLVYSIMSNATINTGIGRGYCRYGKLMPYISKVTYEHEQHFSLTVHGVTKQDAAYMRLQYEETVNKLTFVSCGGNRGKDSFGLYQLICSYNWIVWILILMAIVTLVALGRRTNSASKDIFVEIIRFIKVLLEQGDPFLTSMLKHTHFRITLAAFLLVGIVISNGYKSDNVYNLIAPRKTIPYTEFQQLVRDNFTVLVRPSSILIFAKVWEFNDTKGLQEWTNILQPSTHTYHELDYNRGFLTRSETMDWYYARRKLGTVKNSPIEMLRDNSSLHPNCTGLVRQAFWNRWEEWNVNGADKHHTDIFVQEIMKLNEDALEKHLQSCNKSALLLPNYKANLIARQVHSDHPTYRISLGSEDYTNFSVGLQVAGSADPDVVRRIQRIVVSGIWDWWSKFLLEMTKFEPVLRSSAPMKPNMHGNVSNIFLILIYGVLGSWTCFCVEIFVPMYRQIDVQLRRLTLFIGTLSLYIKDIYSCLIGVSITRAVRPDDCH